MPLLATNLCHAPGKTDQEENLRFSLTVLLIENQLSQSCVDATLLPDEPLQSNCMKKQNKKSKGIQNKHMVNKQDVHLLVYSIFSGVNRWEKFPLNNM